MRRPWLIVAIVVVVLITVAWWLFIIGPRRSEVAELDDQLQALEAEEQSLRARRAQLLEIQENELTYITSTAELERNVPATPDLASFIDDVNLLAGETNVELLSLTLGLPTPSIEGNYQEVSVIMQTEGQYFELLGFLYGMSDLERIVTVDAISMTPLGATDTGPELLSAAINAFIYTTAPPAAAPPVEGGTAPPATGETGSDTTTTTVGDGGDSE
jgi:Tfp pilus assembly protein PilO